MGTPEFAAASLRALVENGYNVVGVVTVADKPSGRGQKVHSSAVKQYAESQRIPVLQPTNLKDDQFVSELKALAPDVQVVVAFRMLPKKVWALPTLGTFNLHASLLPQYRGSAPINWAIINGERETGVTTFLIDEKIDTGAILLQERVPITESETAGTLHDKLMEVGAALVLKTVDLLESGEVAPTEQPNKDLLSDAPKIFKETCKINWEDEGHKIELLIRGMSPYPTAWAVLHNGDKEFDVKIYDAKFHPSPSQEAIGSLCVEKRQLKVAVKGGYLEIRELQLPAKKRMRAADLLNGFSLAANARFS
ncbi:methionyl-tRNA formyltransferase [Capnocytophaga haemolytica]|uniref:Methionyl-tRNA formyltransferase n=3 Tax=Capnocytophaga haemolytica TaxID=45243 RepID=A0AAX2H279_9FLAO|nr:methionyl-tRNA formyltransferase [Capnocytophaga haemolytica]SNV16023.1 Methionyl-tRNA formyltransferase [Capnocytophaga haemolytica]